MTRPAYSDLSVCVLALAVTVTVGASSYGAWLGAAATETVTERGGNASAYGVLAFLGAVCAFAAAMQLAEGNKARARLMLLIAVISSGVSATQTVNVVNSLTGGLKAVATAEKGAADARAEKIAIAREAADAATAAETAARLAWQAKQSELEAEISAGGRGPKAESIASDVRQLGARAEAAAEDAREARRALVAASAAAPVAQSSEAAIVANARPEWVQLAQLIGTVILIEALSVGLPIGLRRPAEGSGDPAARMAKAAADAVRAVLESERPTPPPALPAPPPKPAPIVRDAPPSKLSPRGQANRATGEDPGGAPLNGFKPRGGNPAGEFAKPTAPSVGSAWDALRGPRK